MTGSEENKGAAEMPFCPVYRGIKCKGHACAWWIHYRKLCAIVVLTVALDESK